MISAPRYRLLLHRSEGVHARLVQARINAQKVRLGQDAKMAGVSNANRSMSKQGLDRGHAVRMNSRDDIEDMILRIGLGDRAAFSSLYDATSAKLFGVCLRVLNNRAEAEDTLQDVFVKVWHKASLYSVNGYSPMTWLITLARNTSIDKLRSRKAGDVDIDEVHDLSDASPTPEAEAIKASERLRLQGCLDELEADRSDAVRRAYLQGDSYKDLAERHGVPLNTMRTWLRRSLLKLRDCLSR